MKTTVVALVGNPNCGKTTLFNALTGSHQRVGNWSGVTVEKHQGTCQDTHIPIEVVDLPGCYGLEGSADSPLDELITYKYLATQEASVIINVLDATHLERHLYLTLQLLEQNKRVVVALNMMDVVDKLKIKINTEALSTLLNCPVVPIVATQKETLSLLRSVVVERASCRMDGHSYRQDSYVGDRDSHATAQNTDFIQQNLDLDRELAIASGRYQTIQSILAKVLSNINAEEKVKFEKKIHVSEKLDTVVLNKFLGIPIFFTLMYLVFVLTIQVGGSLQETFEDVLQTVFIDWVIQGLTILNAPLWLVDILANGVGQGLMTTFSFVPVIACMFFCLSLLEASGYMTRAAFVMDKLMQWVGLSGKAFVPMILGFGCNVPAILGARTLENRRERILTIMMTPFMSCGARLAIYALFVSAFFKEGGHNIIFALYLIGILVALLTGAVLRSTVMQGERSALIMELPRYRLPNLKRIFQSTWHRLNRFLIKAGVIIIPLCALFAAFSAFKTEGKESWLANVGRSVTPLFSPMGIERDNWPATLGLLTGVLAKEVVVGTLNAVYTKEAAINSVNSTQAVVHHDGKRVGMSSNAEALDETLGLNEMVDRFGGSINAFAYLLFVLLYFPCISVLAIIARELNPSWAIFSAVWTTAIAYTVSVVFYQSATFFEHPHSSCLWILGLGALMSAGLWSLRNWVHKKHRSNQQKPVPTQILILDH